MQLNLVQINDYSGYTVTKHLFRLYKKYNKGKRAIVIVDTACPANYTSALISHRGNLSLGGFSHKA